MMRNPPHVQEELASEALLVQQPGTTEAVPEYHSDNQGFYDFERRTRDPTSNGVGGHDAIKEKLTKFQYVLLILLYVVSFSSHLCNSLVAPFLAQHLQNNLDVQTITVGVLIGVYPIGVVLTMPLAQRLLSVVGRSPSMVLGMLLLGCSSLCFGHSEDIARWFVKSDHSAYRRTSLGFFFTFRTLEGLGAAFAQLAATTVVMDSLPESTMGSVLGINEMVIALGYTIGPAVGGVLYSWHGFGLPFVMTGGLSLAASFVIALVLYGQHLKQKLKRARREERRRRRRDQQERADQNSFQEPLLGHGPELQRNRSDVHSPHTEQVVDSQFGNFVSTTSQVYSRTYTMQSTTTVGTIGEEDIERKVNAWKLLLDKDHLLAIVCTIMGCAAFSVQSPILAPNLMSVLHLSERDVGLVFTTISLSYAIAGPFVGYLGDKIGFRKLIGIGFICSGLVQMLLIGGPFGVKTDHHRTWKIVDVYVSFGLFGVAQAFGIVPLLPFMKEVASDEPGTSEVVAASFLTCTTISEGLGSVLGSGLRVLMSYTWSMFAFGTTELALGLAAFLFWAVRNPRTSARFSIPPELA